MPCALRAAGSDAVAGALPRAADGGLGGALAVSGWGRVSGLVRGVPVLAHTRILRGDRMTFAFVRGGRSLTLRELSGPRTSDRVGTSRSQSAATPTKPPGARSCVPPDRTQGLCQWKAQRSLGVWSSVRMCAGRRAPSLAAIALTRLANGLDRSSHPETGVANRGGRARVGRSAIAEVVTTQRQGDVVWTSWRDLRASPRARRADWPVGGGTTSRTISRRRPAPPRSGRSAARRG